MDSNEQPSAAPAEATALDRWQRSLLPFMVPAISALAVFFFVSSYVQLERLNTAVASRPDEALDAVLTRLDDSAMGLSAGEVAEMGRFKVQAQLERHVIGRRYDQINSTLLLRAWTRQMGFITGMILAFVGAIFILAKMSDSGTKLEGEGTGIKGALSTSSPGIVLCVLGSALMMVTLTVDFAFKTEDRAIYLLPVERTLQTVAQSPQASPEASLAKPKTLSTNAAAAPKKSLSDAQKSEMDAERAAMIEAERRRMQLEKVSPTSLEGGPTP